MGQSQTRLPDLPGPEVRPRPRRRSHSKRQVHRESGFELEQLRHTRRLSHSRERRRRNADEQRSVLRETDGNSHKAGTGAQRARKQQQQHRKPPEDWRDEHPFRPRRTRKPGDTVEKPSRSSPRTTRPQASSARRSDRQQRSKSKEPAVRVEEIELETLDLETLNLEEAASKRDCVVCVESRSLRHFPQRPPTAQCTHEINTCKRCLRNWIKSEFGAKVWDQMSCPECGVQMQYDDMKEFAPSDVFRRYDRLSTRATLEAIPGFRWCIAKGCKSGQVHEGDLTPRFRCIGCKASHCVVHQVKWHRGETCAQYDYRTDRSIKKAEEAASNNLIKKTAKKCPGCKWNIEKNNGCDHMRCSKCKHEFCWVCLAAYGPIRDRGNQMHRRTCLHWAEGPPNMAGPI